jgi:hypothetical protein
LRCSCRYFERSTTRHLSRLRLGGTGKYKGITGTVPYTVVELHEAVGGRSAVIVNHKATWEIK